ncbi:hypothetical protein A8C32_03750 [Flavivirga aquatica]|uniref:DUF3289 domain-containing protein n=1 Tax=Flavivirga aquatica TaxID=1849968 RepID=A0A1E5TB12_9FLAO|nr:DUF3289 family protein [Flavivirga aquatica]OEK08575.1 hypothetical protein A8C32_03750 [Flavivirga aquatica]
MKDTPNEIIEEEVFNNKVWLEATTLNMLPGEVVTFTIDDKSDNNADPVITQTTVNKDGKAFVLLELNNEIEHDQKVITSIEDSGYFKKGWWSIDEAGEQPITRAVPGMHVYFHIETTISDGEQVYVELYEDDNNEKEETGRGDKDEHQALVSTVTKEPSKYKIVNRGKIIKSIILDNFESSIDEDVDKQIELYFRCSYNKENVELPYNSNDYLVVGTLVIDRYKMPGLNGSGTDIANDLSYGTGKPRLCENEDDKFVACKIYDNGQVPKFKVEYESNGFDEEKHALFTNKKDLPVVESVLKKTNEDQGEVTEVSPNRFSVIIEETTRAKIDKTYVKTSKADDYYRQSEYTAQQATRNLKAKYTKEEIENLGDMMKVTVNTGESYLWLDFKIMEGLMVWGKLSSVLDQMIAKFRSNTGGIFENMTLTNSVKNNPSTKNYCRYVENYIAEKIKQETFQNITKIEDKEPDFEEKDEKNSLRRKKDKIKGKNIISDKLKLPVSFTRPSFTYKNNNNLLEGRTLAINDIWATEVILKELRNKEENYTVKYQVTLWDNFGLDKPDMQKFFYHGAGFRAWFVLQHIYGYKPFVTKITFEKEFKGNIKEGREERLKKQKIKEEELTPAQKRDWNKATSPLPSGSKW